MLGYNSADSDNTKTMTIATMEATMVLSGHLAGITEISKRRHEKSD